LAELHLKNRRGGEGRQIAQAKHLAVQSLPTENISQKSG